MSWCTSANRTSECLGPFINSCHPQPLDIFGLSESVWSNEEQVTSQWHRLDMAWQVTIYSKAMRSFDLLQVLQETASPCFTLDMSSNWFNAYIWLDQWWSMQFHDEPISNTTSTTKLGIKWRYIDIIIDIFDHIQTSDDSWPPLKTC